MTSLHTFVAPSPSRQLQAVTRWLNDHLILPGLFRVSKVHADAGQLAQLRELTTSGHAVFLTPNHPRYGTDWLIDKWLFDRAAPGCVSWADPAIVNGTGRLMQRFWLKSGLVSAVRTADGINPALEYSVGQALQGVPVLLHPEGAVNWDNETIADLYPGTAQMALRCAAQLAEQDAPGRSLVVPVAAFHRFQNPSAAPLHREIDDLERRLRAPGLDSENPATRLEALFRIVLGRLAEQVGQEAPDTGVVHFDVMALCMPLTQRLVQRYPALQDAIAGQETSAGAVRALLRAGSRLAAAKDPSYRVLAKAMRLYFPDWTRTLSLEQLEARAKRLREDHVVGSVGDVLRRMAPRPTGPMEAFLHVGAPIYVVPAEPGSLPRVAELSAELHTALVEANHQAKWAAERTLGPQMRFLNSFLRPF